MSLLFGWQSHGEPSPSSHFDRPRLPRKRFFAPPYCRVVTEYSTLSDEAGSPCQRSADKPHMGLFFREELSLFITLDGGGVRRLGEPPPYPAEAAGKWMPRGGRLEPARRKGMTVACKRRHKTRLFKTCTSCPSPSSRTTQVPCLKSAARMGWARRVEPPPPANLCKRSFYLT